MLMTESNQQDEQQVEKIIDILVRLFIYIYSRDLFFDHYRKFLCNRLLNKTSKNIEMEKNVVAKLKAEAGQSAVNKLNTMISDIK